MLGLGEFLTDRFSGGQKTVLWLFFISSSMFTQVLFVNMLVAVMAKTLGQVLQAKEDLELQQRTQSETDWIWLSYRDYISSKY